MLVLNAHVEAKEEAKKNLSLEYERSKHGREVQGGKKHPEVLHHKSAIFFRAIFCAMEASSYRGGPYSDDDIYTKRGSMVQKRAFVSSSCSGGQEEC